MSPLLDSEQVVLRLQHLKKYISILKMLQKFTLKEIEGDVYKTGALLHYLQLSAEACIDIGEMIISAESFEIPLESAAVFQSLAAAKIITVPFSKKFSAIARFRNLLVHEYVKIDMQKVYFYLQKELGQFEAYTKAIGRYLKRKE